MFGRDVFRRICIRSGGGEDAAAALNAKLTLSSQLWDPNG